jgi:hypothetical protein
LKNADTDRLFADFKFYIFDKFNTTKHVCREKSARKKTLVFEYLNKNFKKHFGVNLAQNAFYRLH